MRSVMSEEAAKQRNQSFYRSVSLLTVDYANGERYGIMLLVHLKNIYEV